jgi:hypothetical protein
LVQLHLDPERKGDPFAVLPKVATLRSLPGAAPSTEKVTMRWTGADTLAVEVPLDGGETTLTTVDVPGHGAVPLPPVCLPYSPEFKPGMNDRGLVTLEHLGRATAGRERIDLVNIWKDLPRHQRLIPISRWLLLFAVVLWLVEVLERRTAVLSALRKRRRRAVKPVPEAEEKPEKARPLPAAAAKAAVKTAAAVPVPARKTETPAAPVPAPKAEPVPVAAPAAKGEDGGMSEALRKARQRARGRTE